MLESRNQRPQADRLGAGQTGEMSQKTDDEGGTPPETGLEAGG